MSSGATIESLNCKMDLDMMVKDQKVLHEELNCLRAELSENEMMMLNVLKQQEESAATHPQPIILDILPSNDSVKINIPKESTKDLDFKKIKKFHIIGNNCICSFICLMLLIIWYHIVVLQNQFMVVEQNPCATGIVFVFVIIFIIVLNAAIAVGIKRKFIDSVDITKIMESTKDSKKTSKYYFFIYVCLGFLLFWIRIVVAMDSLYLVEDYPRATNVVSLSVFLITIVLNLLLAKELHRLNINITKEPTKGLDNKKVMKFKKIRNILKHLFSSDNNQNLLEQR